jgi:hypothetical protein
VIEKLKFNQAKKPIRMNLGDPTIGKNIGPHEIILKAVEDVLKDGNFNGYLPAAGNTTVLIILSNFEIWYPMFIFSQFLIFFSK